jgi:hypothetical protein
MKIHSVDILPSDGSHYLVVNGEPWARFDSIETALQAREELIREEAV